MILKRKDSAIGRHKNDIKIWRFCKGDADIRTHRFGEEKTHK